jgi:hypothetical protein
LRWAPHPAASALHVNADAGAYAGLALDLQVVLASLLIPLAFRLFQGLAEAAFAAPRLFS